MKRQEDVTEVPWIGDEIDCQLPYRQGRMVGTVVASNHDHRFYVVEFTGEKGDKFRVSYKLGGQQRSMYNYQPDNWHYFHPPKGNPGAKHFKKKEGR